MKDSPPSDGRLPEELPRSRTRSVANLTLNLTLALLGAALLVQASLLAGGLFDARVVPLGVGQPLPFEVSTQLGSGTESCSQAFVCSAACPYCRSLADSLQMGSSLVEGQAVKWLLVGGGYEDWISRFPLLAENSFSLSPTSHGWGIRREVGNIWATPFRLVLDEQLNVRDARPSRSVLSETSLIGLCSKGGVAPESAQEWIELNRLGVIE